MLSLLAALLVGCGGSHDARVTAELDRADSLLRTSDTAAHSAALRQMLALDTARALQSDEALRARHALLLVQARYKCYVTIPADSALIDQARRYYADHHGSSANHERYTRTLIYSGAVAEELGHPQQAMQYYLEAEDTADPNDHFNLGYVNLRIGGIYESEYTTDSTDLVRYKYALPHFEKAGSDYYQAVCLTGIGGLYRTHNNDSALHYLQQAISFSKEHGLTYNYYKSLDKLCGLYYYLAEYKKSKDLATKLIQENQGEYDGTQYLSYGIRSFAELGMTDSAEQYFKMLPLPQSLVDSMRWLKDLAEIYRSKGDFRNYSVYAFKSDSIADVLMLNSYQVQLKEAEEKYNNASIKLNSAQKQNVIYILLIVLFALSVLLLILSLLYQRVRKRHLMSLAEMGTISSRLIQAEKMLKENHSATQKAVEAHFAVVKELNEKLSYDMTSISFFDLLHGKRVNCDLSLEKLSDKFWVNLRTAVDAENAGIVSHIEDMNVCDNNDVRLVMLCFFGLSNEVIKLCMNFTNKRTVSNYKNRIIKLISTTENTLDEYKMKFISLKNK